MSALDAQVSALLSRVIEDVKLHPLTDKELVDAQRELMWFHGQIQRELIQREQARNGRVSGP